MELIFRQLPANEMERPPTQRDQFNNDDVELVDALVRESIQNSLDAWDKSGADLVRVSFDIRTFGGAQQKEVLTLLEADKLDEHLVATGLPGIGMGAEMSVLTVEDFGTTGLVGRWDDWDEAPFCDFWRRMGRSHKSGKSLGRWGLGKLVFSSASRARVFLGLTVRNDDREALLMGQAVLTHHKMPDGSRLDSHAFYAINGKLGDENFQVPERCDEVLESFKNLFYLMRSDKPGLSIVVPALRDNITLDRISQGVLKNYFFPILFGRLEVHVGKAVINDASFASLSKTLGGDDFSDGHLAAFIADMKATRDDGFTPPFRLPSGWKRMGMEMALGTQLAVMREQIGNGEVVMVRAPILMKRRDGTELESYVDAFLQRAPTDAVSMFVRDAIVLNAERKYFRARKVFGALIADHHAVSEFLGDAENPAHTGWSATAEKVSSNWRNAKDRLSDIRQLLKLLHDTLVSAVDATDKNALVRVFSLPADDGSTTASPEGKEARPPVVPSIEAKPRSFKVSRLQDGFKVENGLISEEELPATIRVRAAYDVVRGNPFKKHNAADFDFSGRGVEIVSLGATVTAASANTLIIEVSKVRFAVAVKGFDPNRDLIIASERVS